MTRVVCADTRTVIAAGSKLPAFAAAEANDPKADAIIAPPILHVMLWLTPDEKFEADALMTGVRRETISMTPELPSGNDTKDGTRTDTVRETMVVGG